MEKFDTSKNVILFWSKAVVTQSDEEFPPRELYGTTSFTGVNGGAVG
jgi:hypothetical protein